MRTIWMLKNKTVTVVYGEFSGILLRMEFYCIITSHPGSCLFASFWCEIHSDASSCLSLLFGRRLMEEHCCWWHETTFSQAWILDLGRLWKYTLTYSDCRRAIIGLLSISSQCGLFVVVSYKLLLHYYERRASFRTVTKAKCTAFQCNAFEKKESCDEIKRRRVMDVTKS